MNRTYVLFLVLSLAISAFAYDFTALDTNGNTLYYNKLGADSVEVTHGDNYGCIFQERVIVPSIVSDGENNYRVTGIGELAFTMSIIPAISLPNTIRSIGKSAFGETYLDSISIPNSVITIAERAFRYALLKAVSIPYSVQSIEDLAFSNTDLVSVAIPNSVISIGNNAFEGVFNIVYSGVATGAPWGAQNMNLYSEDIFVYEDATKKTIVRCSLGAEEKITIPNGVKTIGENAFFQCFMNAVEVPNSVTTIGDGAFHTCNNLSSIAIPNSVTSIGNYAFINCNSLESITIPKGVTSLGAQMFEGCDKLIYMIVEQDNPIYDSRNNCNAIIETASNKLLFGCKNSVIPNTITTIADNAFRTCGGLVSIDIPQSVTYIGQEAFNTCPLLEKVICHPITPPNVGFVPFAGCAANAVLCVPYESIASYKGIAEYMDVFAEIQGFSDVVNISETTATLEWLPDSTVIEYTINIYTSDTLFAQFIVDGNGHLLSSTHQLPSVFHQRKDSTSSSTDYYVLTMNDLSAGTDYDYTISGKNASNVQVYFEEGTFTTEEEGTEGLFENVADDPNKVHKIIHSGKMFIICGEEIYTMQGMKMQ